MGAKNANLEPGNGKLKFPAATVSSYRRPWLSTGAIIFCTALDQAQFKMHRTESEK